MPADKHYTLVPSKFFGYRGISAYDGNESFIEHFVNLKNELHESLLLLSTLWGLTFYESKFYQGVTEIELVQCRKDRKHTFLLSGSTITAIINSGKCFSERPTKFCIPSHTLICPLGNHCFKPDLIVFDLMPENLIAHKKERLNCRCHTLFLFINGHWSFLSILQQQASYGATFYSFSVIP